MSSRIYIRSRGGRMGVNQLGILCKAAIKNQIKEFRLSSRQEIVLDEVESENMKFFKEELLKNEINIYKESKNTLSSMMSVGVFSTTPWLTQGIYSKVLNDIPESLLGTISFVDPNQEYVPLLESDYNFIADSLANYWYLVVKKKDKKNPFFVWTVRIGTDSIPEFIKTLDYRLEELGEKNLMFISEEINSYLEFDNLSYLDEFALPTQHYNLPDGFYGLEPQNLFVFSDSYKFAMLDALVSHCNSVEIDFIYLSPWKSIMVGSILESKKNQWLSFLNWQNIKTGRAYQELNWRLELADKQSLKLKTQLTSFFNKSDLRVNGLSFSICKEFGNAKSGNFVVKICKNRLFGFVALYDLIQLDKKNHKTLGTNLSLMELKNQLTSAIKSHQKNLLLDEQFKQEIEKNQTQEVENAVFGCKDCFTVYLSDAGEPNQGIEANTKFEELPSNFRCPTCGNKKEDFVPINIKSFLM